MYGVVVLMALSTSAGQSLSDRAGSPSALRNRAARSISSALNMAPCGRLALRLFDSAWA